MPEERKNGNTPFLNSLSALSWIAVREAGASGYVFLRRDRDSLLQMDAGGEHVDFPQGGNERTGHVTLLPVGNDAVLALGFDGTRSVPCDPAEPRLARIGAALRAVWEAAREAARYPQLAVQVAELEARLRDSKIADRVRGLLNEYETDDLAAVDAIERHVEGVLRSPSARHVLEQLAGDLEDQVEERRLTNRAKSILRNKQGLTEEEAHAHLRRMSRISRRKLREVAEEVIKANSQTAA